LAIYGDEVVEADEDDEDDAQSASTEWQAYIHRLRASSRVAVAERLAPSSSATSLRLSDGNIELNDGPFTDAREQLRGYCIVSARDLNDAVHLASECPAARKHAIVVRPIRSARS
jgi:hypothetical protein